MECPKLAYRNIRPRRNKAGDAFAVITALVDNIVTIKKVNERWQSWRRTARRFARQLSL